MPFWAARCSSGPAALSASLASFWSPAVIASSTLRRKVRTRLLRDLFSAVRVAILRVAFLAELVFAINSSWTFHVRGRRHEGRWQADASNESGGTRPPSRRFYN